MPKTAIFTVVVAAALLLAPLGAIAGEVVQLDDATFEHHTQAGECFFFSILPLSSSSFTNPTTTHTSLSLLPPLFFSHHRRHRPDSGGVVRQVLRAVVRPLQEPRARLEVAGGILGWQNNSSATRLHREPRHR